MFGKKTDEQKREHIAKAYAGSRAHFPEVPEITADELLARLGDEGLLIVDVRQPHEREVSMLPGAIAASDFEASGRSHSFLDACGRPAGERRGSNQAGSRLRTAIEPRSRGVRAGLVETHAKVP